MNMSQTHSFWEESSNVKHVKYESSIDEHTRLKERTLYSCCDGNLNFATAACSEDDSEYSASPYKKNKMSRQDPMSHRIIEKRRRDRMNNCLADLSRLIPAEYLKKGRGRIEKTEIIEMAIKHMKHLHNLQEISSDHYRLGYQECMSETMRFLVEIEGHFPREAFCVRLLNHLQKHCEALSRGPTSLPVKEHLSCDHDSEEIVHQPAISPIIKNIQQNVEEEYSTLPPSQCEPERNNNLYVMTEEEHSHARNVCDLDFYEKHSDSNGSVSYKYKNEIKLRFSQDVNSAAKHQRLGETKTMRRNSSTSIENHSSSHSSPACTSDICTRISSETDTQQQVSPTDTPSSRLHNYKTGTQYEDKHEILSSSMKSNRIVEVKTNFSVPIFVLHAKGAFYVPLTVDYYTLLPFLQNCNLLEAYPNTHNIVLHPVTINVNFQPNSNIKCKSEYVHVWH